jgi:hypothetical protein
LDQAIQISGVYKLASTLQGGHVFWLDEDVGDIFVIEWWNIKVYTPVTHRIDSSL